MREQGSGREDTQKRNAKKGEGLNSNMLCVYLESSDIARAFSHWKKKLGTFGQLKETRREEEVTEIEECLS